MFKQNVVFLRLRQQLAAKGIPFLVGPCIIIIIIIIIKSGRHDNIITCVYDKVCEHDILQTARGNFTEFTT